MLYSLPYILLVLFLICISVLQLGMPIEEKSRKYINYIVVITYIVFFGFRGFIGWDWVSYCPFFKELNKILDLSFSTSTTDVGFTIYASLIKTINPDYNFFILISAIINVTLLHCFFNRYLSTRYYALAFALFIAIGGVILELNLMRNIKGLLLFLISIRYIEERKPIKYFLLNLLGFFFHWSSIFFFPLYFFIHKRINAFIIIIIFITGNIIYLSQIEYIKPFVEWLSGLLGEVVEGRSIGYLASNLYSKQYGITLGYLERVCTTILILFYYNKLIANSKSNIIFINCFFIYLFINLFFSEVNIIITRVGGLFIFSYWILWPKIIECSKNVEKIILFVLISLYMNVRIVSQTNNPMYKYDNIFIGHSDSYKERLKVHKKENEKIQKENK